LQDHQAQAELSKLLATLAYDAPIDSRASTLRRRSAERASLSELGKIMGDRGQGLFDRLSSSAKLLQ